MKDYSFRRSVAEKDVPQRQQIAENGAVAERDCRGNAAQKACSKGAAEIGDPQRQRIAEFAAVAERDCRGDPQRQRIAEFAAVAERDCRGNAAQRACSKGAAEIGDPQRQQGIRNFFRGYLSYLLCVLFVSENSYMRRLRIFARF